MPERSGVLTSARSDDHLRFRAVGLQDTFPLYGGPTAVLDRDPGEGPWPNVRPRNEGKFEDPSGWVPDRQGWVGVDLTDVKDRWQLSDFNAANLGGNGPGNRAFWCGQTAAEQPGWVSGTGYGNQWWEQLLLDPLAPLDPAVGQTVSLDFRFNIEIEPSYDAFSVEYDSAGTWVRVFSIDGTNKDASGLFPVPGLQYAPLASRPILFAGGDYGTDGRIHLRFLFESDTVFSDEDGLWPTDAGAVQVDDISVVWDGGSIFDDFEGAGPFHWAARRSPFAGDFSDVYSMVSDVDPCRHDFSPLIGFIDHGQAPPNGPTPRGVTSTGGSLGSTSYGIPGGWVVNYTGGLSMLDGLSTLDNEVWSPPIAWDLPGSADDDPAIAGSYLRFSVWAHLPLSNGIFYKWHVRSRAAGESFGPWKDRNFVYGESVNGLTSAGRWKNVVEDTTDLIATNPVEIQVALGVQDLADYFGFPGNDATPSPLFDNVAFVKYRIEGPAISTREVDLSNDGFPVNGSIDAGTSAAAAALNIPFDMARDVNSGRLVNDPGDSITADVRAVIPGTTITDIRMLWALDRNPLFDPYRSIPSGRIGTFGGPKDVNVDTTSDPGRWFGEVLADTSKTQYGIVVGDRFFFDLPDEDFLYPGDVLRYAIQATDSDGRVATLPPRVGGLATGTDPVSGETYSRTFTIRGLPSIRDASGTQPTKLIYNDLGHGGEEDEFLSAMGQLGLAEGVDYDTYTVQAPSQRIDNGLGSAGAHGANVGQLAGYDTIVLLAGDLSTGILSDGSNEGFNDSSDNVGVMTDWKNLSGARNTVYFGDNITSGLATLSSGSSAAAAYVETIMGVGLTDGDVRDEIDFQTAPRVAPTSGAPASFVSSYVAFGGCPEIRQFDSIFPLATAIAGHEFLGPDGSTGSYAPAASVIYDRVVNGADRKVDITFSHSLMAVYEDNRNKAPVALPARARLLAECFEYLGVSTGDPGSATDAPSVLAADLHVYPRPFNPRATIRFTSPRPGAYRIAVYDVRGQRVETLHEGELEAGPHVFRWSGKDERGRGVASGVYFVRAVGMGVRLSERAVLVK